MNRALGRLGVCGGGVVSECVCVCLDGRGCRGVRRIGLFPRLW